MEAGLAFHNKCLLERRHDIKMLQRDALAISLESPSVSVWLFILTVGRVLTLFSINGINVDISKTNEGTLKVTKCKIAC
jgi:hypothetical protein